MNKNITSNAPRRVTILGSTGSIGTNTVELLQYHGERFTTEAVVAGSNAALLAKQAIELRAKLAVVADDKAYAELKALLSGTGIEVASGATAVVAAAERPSDWVMAAIVGAAGLQATLAAARRGAMIAFANKEVLVCAGELMLEEVRRAGASLIPVDSEHSAIAQVFEEEGRQGIARLILTASGGPFRTTPKEQMRSITPEQALKHPNWTMGAKISIDSATMMNKGLEIIEAHHLFAMPLAQIDVLVHPQSVVHSLVEYIDGSVLAQLGTPDMKTPISYALGWPQRLPTPAARLDLLKTGSLTFEAPDLEKFPSINLARQALQQGGTAPTLLNAANEVAVAAFLQKRIGFMDIPALVAQILGDIPSAPALDIESIERADAEARRHTETLILKAA